MKQPSQPKSSASVADEDCEIINSGSLFGTQHSSQQKATQKSISSQTSMKDKIANENEVSDNEQDAIGGSQCMFGSNPNSSSENDVEMMSEGSEDEDQDLEVAKVPKNTQVLCSKEAGEKRVGDTAHESSNRQRASPGTVRTIPESAASVKQATEQSPISGSKSSRNRTKNSNSSSSRKSPSSGSASTCIPTSKNASVSPDKLSDQPIQIIRKSSKENSLKQSKNSSLENESPQSSSSRSRRRSGRLSGKEATSVASGKTGGSEGPKAKPQKLSDIDLSDGDVDGDHDLLFEEDDDEVNVLTPVGGVDGEEKTARGRKTTEGRTGTLPKEASIDHRSPRTSSPIKPTKLGVSPTEEMNGSENEDELDVDDDKETIDPNNVQENIEVNQGDDDDKSEEEMEVEN